MNKKVIVNKKEKQTRNSILKACTRMSIRTARSLRSSQTFAKLKRKEQNPLNKPCKRRNIKRRSKINKQENKANS
jgi:hypothetical protein